LKIKIEASGFPENVKTEEDKIKFKMEYKEKYGIEIDLENVKYNPGLRHIAKLCLNSLWGKFSMRNTLAKSEIIIDPSEYFKLIFDHKKEINMILPMSDTTMRLVYKDKKEYCEEHNSSNIVCSILWHLIDFLN
jgi:hypothetical protein